MTLDERICWVFPAFSCTPGQGAEKGRGDPEGLQRPGGCSRGVAWEQSMGGSLGDPQNHRFEYRNSLILIDDKNEVPFLETS